jgi:hypothetical protein
MGIILVFIGILWLPHAKGDPEFMFTVGVILWGLLLHKLGDIVRALEK